jgi:hypothetical protein
VLSTKCGALNPNAVTRIEERKRVAVPRAHLPDRGCEQPSPVEDVGVLGEKAEDQPRHEMVHH